MYEYETSRSKTLFTRVIVVLVLLTSGAALVLTGNNGLRDFVGGDQNVAVIGDKRISTTELGNLYGHALQQNGLNDAMARQMGFPSMVLQREIDRQVMLQAAEKSGIRVDNKYVATQLVNQLNQITLPGTPREKLQMVLAQQKLTEAQLVDLLRGDYAGGLLAGVANPPSFEVPEALILSQYRGARETREADLIPLTLNDLKDQKTLSDADVSAYFNEHKEEYRTPETRDITMLVLPQASFTRDEPVSDTDAQAYFNAHKDQFNTTERVRLEQIIADSEDGAKKIIADKPADFAAYKQNGAQALKADWYGKTNLPKEFVSALYPEQKTGLIGPIKTPLGWHVLNVQSYEQAKPQDFAAARTAVEKAIKAERLETQMTDFTDDIDNQLASNASLQDIAGKYKLPVVAVKNLQKDDATKQLKDVATAVQQRVTEAAFNTETGETSPLLDTSDGEYVLVQVAQVNPSAIPEFSTVKDRVTADANAADRSKNLTALSEKLIGAFDPKSPEKFDALVKDSGVKIQTLKPVTKAEMEKLNGKAAAELLFTLSPDNALSYTQTGDNVMLIRLRKIMPSTASPDDAAMKATTDVVRNNIAQELQQQFGQALQQQVKVKVDMSVLQAAFGKAPDAETQPE